MSEAALQPEDEARAALYGLVARLYYAPLDEGTIAHLLHADSFGGGEDRLSVAWREVLDACRNAFPAVLEQEHTELFVGTGKAEVTPYLTNYVARHAVGHPLVELRQRLADWSIARKERAGEPEDHIAGVCEAMRYAIAVQHRSEEEQKSFFEAFVYPGAMPFFEAVSASPRANFYRPVSHFAREFFEIEREAFEMI